MEIEIAWFKKLVAFSQIYRTNIKNDFSKLKKAFNENREDFLNINLDS